MIYTKNCAKDKVKDSKRQNKWCSIFEHMFKNIKKNDVFGIKFVVKMVEKQ